MFGGIGEQGHEASLLQCAAQTALMLGAGSRLATGFDLPTIRNVTLDEAIGIFIVNFAHMVVAKLTDFAAR